MKALVIIVALIATVGIGVYQLATKKIPVKPESMSQVEMAKAIEGCKVTFRKDQQITPAQEAQMEVACECMIEATATTLKNKDGVTMVDWMTQVPKNSAACMAKAGIPVQ